MALRHLSGHFRCGQLTYPHCSWASLLCSLPVFSAHSFASNWQLPFLNQRTRIRPSYSKRLTASGAVWSGSTLFARICLDTLWYWHSYVQIKRIVPLILNQNAPVRVTTGIMGLPIQCHTQTTVNPLFFFFNENFIFAYICKFDPIQHSHKIFACIVFS